MNIEQQILHNHFRNKVKEIVKSGQGTLADWDMLRVYVDADPSIFPESIRQIVQNGSSTSDGRVACCKRIEAIYQALSHIPEALNRRKTEIENVELIPLFTLSEKDSERVAKLCGDMRKIIISSSDFDQPHKVRLLNRIAAIEAETQKPQGIFDVVRGGINDLGETLGKFGKDIKPLTERMNEVVSIARRGTKEYDKLPEPDEVKRLPAPSEEEEE